jgi:hypothetical protein
VAFDIGYYCKILVFIFAKIVDFFNWFDVNPGSNDVYQRNRMTQKPLKERGNSTIVLNAMLLTIRRQGQTELDAVSVTGGSM